MEDSGAYILSLNIFSILFFLGNGNGDEENRSCSVTDLKGIHVISNDAANSLSTDDLGKCSIKCTIMCDNYLCRRHRYYYYCQ